MTQTRSNRSAILPDAVRSEALLHRFQRLQQLYWRRPGHRPRILVLGAGYAGLTCALGLQGVDAEVTLVNPNDHHHLTTLLHEPAVGRRDFHEATVDLPGLLAGTGIRLHRGSAVALDLEAQTVTVETAQHAQALGYDFLVVALGSQPEFHAIPGLGKHALTLGSWSEAARLHLRVEEALIGFKEHPEQAWRAQIVVGGAGLTGVELAGELADWCRTVAPAYGVSPKHLKITLVDGAPTVLAACAECQDKVIPLATRILKRKGISIVTGARVQAIEPHQVVLTDGRALEAGLIVWTGGVRGHALLERAGLALGRQKRAAVNEFLQAEGHPEVFVLGDSAAASDGRGHTLPPTAQIAVHQGPLVAENFRRLLGGQPLQSCAPKRMGVFLSLGRRDALGVIQNKIHLSGWAARTVKNAIAYRYLALLGGPRLVWNKWHGRRVPVRAAPPRRPGQPRWWQRLGAATGAGLLGTAAMTALGAMATSFGLEMNAAAMLSGAVGIPLWAGWLAHAGIGVGLAWLYALGFARALSGPAFAKGALFGLLPFLLAQLGVMPMVGAGVFASQMGQAAPMLVLGSLMGHLVYGGVVGWGVAAGQAGAD